MFFLVIVLSLTACENTTVTPISGHNAHDHPDPNDPLLIEIKDLEKKVQSDTVMDRNTGLRLLKAYQDYYNKHSRDSVAVTYLFEAARVAVDGDAALLHALHPVAVGAAGALFGGHVRGRQLEDQRLPER